MKTKFILFIGAAFSLLVLGEIAFFGSFWGYIDGFKGDLRIIVVLRFYDIGVEFLRFSFGGTSAVKSGFGLDSESWLLKVAHGSSRPGMLLILLSVLISAPRDFEWRI